MKRPSRWIAVAVLGALSTLLVSLARADEPAEKPKEPPHYESPIVAILFLPVTVLLKIAEVVSPDAPRSGGSDEKSE
jgi:hypothetical protein